ncbi:MAG: phosphate ABC transporter permease PstA [Cyanosarcina radialis HA8281-LM2]|jgi:phosphate transport system permease protein|nr:phosphate ABC transporter permease PstA [Cyanosarcina radialis HA8281-LM2]
MSTSRPIADLDSPSESNFNVALPSRHGLDKIFEVASWVATFVGLIVLAALLIDTVVDSLPRLSWGFITNFPSTRAVAAGVLPALVGTLWLLVLTTLVAFPLGVGAGIYLEEYAPDNLFTRAIEINISNLAAVPSIIYGLLGLQVFVRWLLPVTGGRSILAGALTLALLVLPIIIITTRESLRAIPGSLRQAGFALGATRWQVIREHIFPLALPGILTGTILAISRAIGETAPLIVVGAATFITFLPTNLQSKFTALPIQIFNWVSRPVVANPDKNFQFNAAAGIVVLMVVLLGMNSIAIFLRNKFQKGRA